MSEVGQRYWFLAATSFGDNETEAEIDDLEKRMGTYKQPHPVGDVEVDPERRAEQKARSRNYVSVSEPWWPEAYKFVYEDEGNRERLEAPQLYSTREAAEKELHSVRVFEMESDPQVVEEEPIISEYKIFSLDREAITSKLKDCNFLCVVSDGRLKLRQDFVEELEGNDE